jgi:hypothetical protein
VSSIPSTGRIAQTRFLVCLVNRQIFAFEKLIFRAHEEIVVAERAFRLANPNRRIAAAVSSMTSAAKRIGTGNFDGSF